MKPIYVATALATSILAAGSFVSISSLAAQTHDHEAKDAQPSSEMMMTHKEMRQNMMQHMRTCMKDLEQKPEDGSVPQDAMTPDAMQDMREQMMKHMGTCMEQMGEKDAAHMPGGKPEHMSAKPDADDAKHDHNKE